VCIVSYFVHIQTKMSYISTIIFSLHGKNSLKQGQIHYDVNELDPNMVLDRTLWRNLIHVAIPT